MEYNALDQISQRVEIIFEGWHNGKKGAICDEKGNGIFRFIETYRGENGMWNYRHLELEDNPIVCVGIAGQWLIRRRSGSNLLNKLTQLGAHLDSKENVREMYKDYTEMRFRQYKYNFKDNPQMWDWEDDDWKRAFYCDYIIPHETELNKISKSLLEFLSEDDGKLVRLVMDNYIEYLEKCKEEWMPAPTNIFNYKLNEKAIEDTIRITYNKYNKTGLGEINFTYAIHYFFESINWLSDVKDTRFVSWMKYHKLMTVKASNLKQAKKEDERVVSLMKELYSIFQTKHPNKDRWIDKNEYYLEGFEHSKINDGNH